MSAQLIPRPNSCTLYELEDTLQAWVNTIVMAEEPTNRDAILAEIGQALKKTKEKRDAVVGFLRHCEQQEKFADAEIERIEKRKGLIARVTTAHRKLDTCQDFESRGRSLRHRIFSRRKNARFFGRRSQDHSLECNHRKTVPYDYK